MNMSIHVRIKQRREQLKKSQGWLAAEVSRLEGLSEDEAFSYTTVQAWERTNDKATAPKLERLPYVAIALQCSIGWLVTGGKEIGDPPDLPSDSRVIVQHDPNKLTLHLCKSDEDALLEKYRMSTAEGKMKIMDAAIESEKHLLADVIGINKS